MKGYLLWLSFCGLVVVTLLWLVGDGLDWQERLQSAKQAGELVEQARRLQNASDKKQMLNAALTRYLALQPDDNKDYVLNEAIGYIALELGELPYAALYYLRALDGKPRDQALHDQTALLFDRLGQPMPSTVSWLSHKEWIWLIASLTGLVWLCSWGGFQRTAWILCLIALLLSGWFVNRAWLSPTQALVIAPDFVKLEAESELVLPGMTLTVIKAYIEQQLLLVRLPNGKEGYLAMTAAAKF